jgi:hypothetical protein
MIFRKKKKPTAPSSKIDTIVVIGNGFDRWQGLNTSYADFQTYYHEHLDEILKTSISKSAGMSVLTVRLKNGQM